MASELYGKRFEQAKENGLSPNKSKTYEANHETAANQAQ